MAARLVSLELAGFKGQRQTHELPPRLILSGPNGAGKSAVLDALRLALCGLISGPQVEKLARLVGPRGGTVKVTDADGDWLERGAEIDAEAGTVREILQVAGAKGAQAAHRKAATDRWEASELLLDSAALAALSPEARREELLRLCGSAERLTDQQLVELAGAGFARQLAGPGATWESIQAPGVLPAGLQLVLGAWMGQAGPGDQLAGLWRSMDRGALEALSAGIDLLGDLRRKYAGAAKESAAAAQELARGQAEAPEADRARKAAEDELRELRRTAQERELVRTRLAEKARTVERLERDLAGLRDKLAALPAVSKVQAAPSREQINAAEDARTAAGQAHDQAMDLYQQHLEAQKVLKDDAAFLAELRARPEKLLVDGLSALPKGLHPDLPRLIGLALAMSAETDGRLAHLEAALARVKAAFDKLPVMPSKSDLERLEDAADVAREARDRMRKLASDAEDQRLRSGEPDRLRTQISGLESELSIQSAQRAVVTVSAGTYRADLDQAIHLQEQAVAELQRIAGARGAYESALSRARAARASEEAAKLGEAALRAERQALTEGAVAPLMEAAGAMLRAAGRSETPAVQLLTPKGRPTCDLGWIAPEDPRLRHVETLSGGEAVLFGAALLAALAMRLPGRRVLMIEADACDNRNLDALFRGLAAVPVEDVPNIIIATSRPVLEAEGWDVSMFGRCVTSAPAEVS